MNGIHRTLAKLVRYLFTGGTAAIVDVVGFDLLSLVRIPVAAAAGTSFAVATVVNFFLTARLVFDSPATIQSYALFLAGALFGALVNVTITTIGVTSMDLSRIAAKTIAVALTFGLNFWINALVVFRTEAE